MGIQHVNNYTVGTVGAGSLGFEIAQDRLYYQGVRSYAKQVKDSTGEDLTGVINTGPFAKHLGPSNIATNYAAQLFDNLYVSGMAVVVPDTSTYSEHEMKQLIGEVAYDSLTDGQLHAMYNTSLIAGNTSDYQPATNSGGSYSGLYHLLILTKLVNNNGSRINIFFPANGERM